MTKTNRLLLVGGVLLLAIFFRFYLITTLPGGLFPDEAANGLDINLMQQGHLQPFYERGNGREALFFYMLWGSVELFGKGPWQHHIVSALVGVLSVWLCYAFTRQLLLVGKDRLEANEKKATTIGLLAAFLMAVSTWHVALSRTAFRANLIPLFSTLTLYLLLKAYAAGSRKLQLLYSFLCGASFALGFYTYIAYRIMVPILLVLVLWPIFASIKEKYFTKVIREFWLPKLVFLVAFVIFIAPLAHYFYTHKGSFIGRSGQVSVFNPSLYLVNGEQLSGKPPLGVGVSAAAEVALQSIKAYFVSGDLNWRHNISGFPFLAPLVSPFFGGALILTTLLALAYFFMPSKNKRWWPYAVLATWFWGMMLPVVTTAEGIPHGLRSIGTIPAVFILAALGMYYVWLGFARLHASLHAKHYPSFGYAWKHRLEGWGPLFVRNLFTLAIILFGAALIVQCYLGYFVYAANSPEQAYYFRSDLTPVSDYLIKRCKKDSTYLVLDKFSVQTTDYFTSDPHGDFASPCSIPYKQVDPEDSWKLSDLNIGDQIVFTQSSIFDIKKFKLYHPNATLVYEVRNKFGQAVMGVYEVSK